MALSDSVDSPEKKAPDIHKGVERKEKLHTKVIIRRLPPSMDQETFLNQISPVPNYDYFYMVKGDASLGENAFSRAYINFTNPNDIYDFKEKFDNYVFLNSAGHEYPAVVEYASFQKVPKKRNKIRVDPKSNTIETDPYYLEFVEMINKPPEQDEKPEYSYQLTAENKNDTTTPLLEFVKNKRAEKLRIREERREERKRKEFERKKFRDEERKKRFDEKSPAKTKPSIKEKVIIETTESEKTENEPLPEKSKLNDKSEKEEVEKLEKSPSSYYKNREKKYEDRKKDIKTKYPPKKEYVDKRDYKGRRDDFKERDYRSKFEDHKREVDPKVQKKVKKYSERREERKMEAQKKLELQTKDQQTGSRIESDTVGEAVKLVCVSPENKSKATLSPENKLKATLDSENTCRATAVLENKSKVVSPEHKPKENPTKRDDAKAATDEKRNGKNCENKSPEKKEKNKDSESQSQRRIRNKDRPTIAIYRPGMLSKRRQSDGEPENKKESCI